MPLISITAVFRTQLNRLFVGFGPSVPEHGALLWRCCRLTPNFNWKNFQFNYPVVQLNQTFSMAAMWTIPCRSVGVFVY